MEFYEFFEQIIGYIPDGFEGLKNICEMLLPWLFFLFMGATCFAGHFMHKVWNVFFFFSIGFFVPLFILFAVFQPSGVLFWLLTVLCIGVGIFCAVRSHQLHKAKLFVTTLIMVYIAVSDYLMFVGKGIAILFGLILAVAAAILSIKYKYITVIATTAFSGSMLFWNMIGGKFSFPHFLITLLIALMGIIGLAIQCYIERKELKESYENIKNNTKKIKEKVSKEK